MNLFDHLVSQALNSRPDLAPLKSVVEKEILHHDILRILSENDLLHNLTFIGGTCLRCCYNGLRLSEDLDFTGGKNFSKDTLNSMAAILIANLECKYGLKVKVTEPKKETGNVDTWKIQIETRSNSKHLPCQRINIDICAVTSYEKKPMLLLNHYGVEMGTSGLVIQSQSLEEIYADKIIALALRPNRIKYRDIWDIIWLHQKGKEPRIELIPRKVEEREHNLSFFIKALKNRIKIISTDSSVPAEFTKEIQRFLPTSLITRTYEESSIWSFVISLMEDFIEKIAKI